MLFVLLFLAVLLQQSAGESDGTKFAAESVITGDQEKLILDKHNDLRRDVQPTAKNMLRMEWNRAAAENARRWAARCVFQHSPGSERTVNGIGCGENLFGSTAPVSWSKAIQTWYDEKKDFKYGIGATRPGADIGHYTQVVWAKSFMLGCAYAHCPGAFYKHFFVCQYCPAGNIQGRIKTPYAAGPPCGDCPRACDNRLCTNPCRRFDKFTNCKDLVNADPQSCKTVDWMKKDCAAACFCPPSSL